MKVLITDKINEVAGKYNGGGHKYASGARIAKKSDVDKIIADLDKVCEEYLNIEERWKKLLILNR